MTSSLEPDGGQGGHLGRNLQKLPVFVRELRLIPSAPTKTQPEGPSSPRGTGKTSSNPSRRSSSGNVRYPVPEVG